MASQKYAAPIVLELSAEALSESEGPHREAVKTFIHQYNTQWLIEKIDFLSPCRARAGYLIKEAA